MIGRNWGRGNREFERAADVVEREIDRELSILTRC